MKTAMTFMSLVLFWNLTFAQEKYEFPNDFGEKSTSHVKSFCGFGKRTAGSQAEQRTIKYLTEKFQRNGLHIEIDTFRYKYYDLIDRSCFINNCKISIKTAYINFPLTDTITFESNCLKYGENSDKRDLNNKVVFTTISKNSIDLVKYGPRAIIVISPTIFDTLRINKNQKYRLDFYGSFSTTDWIKSFNIIATYNFKFPVDSSIVVTAHWDSDPGVGAGDNASGTAALIELSKFFKDKLPDLKYNIIFLATGSHEHDVIGMTSYMINHYNSINKCMLNINVDDIAYVKPYIETAIIRPSQFYSDTLQHLSVLSINTSKSAILTSFREIYGNHQFNSDKMKWLRSKYEKTMNDLKVDYQDAGCCSGSDANVFDYIGIPYITFSSIDPKEEDRANAIEDAYNDSFSTNIQSSGKIISKVILDLNN